MLEWTPYPDHHAARLAYRGTVTGDDYERVVPEIENYLDQAGDVRLLIDLREFAGVDAKAVLEDLKFTTRYLNDFERFAVVTDARWQEQMAKLSDVFTRAEVRTYEPGEQARAEAWLLG